MASNITDKKEFYRFLLRLFLITAAMMLPLWVMLAFKWPRSNDLLMYATILNGFSSQFWQGDWYPRWLVQANAGYGSPNFLFYSPLGFYLCSLLEWLAPWDSHGLGRLALGMQLALFLSGVTSYRWLRGHFPETQAQKGALLYAGFPYLFVIIYYAYGMSQLFAIALFPLVLAAMDTMRATSWRGVPVLAFAFSLLCLMHLPSLVIFIPVALVYSIAMAPEKARIRQALMMGVSGLSGLLLSAIYLLPMLLNKSYIHSELYDNGRINYARNFYEPELLFGFCLMILPLVALYLEQPKNPSQPVITRLMKIWVMIVAMVWFLTLPLSKWLWDALPVLQELQFPRRFYNAMLPGIVFIALSWLPKARSRHVYSCLFILMMGYTSFTCWEFWFSNDSQLIASKPFTALGVAGEYQTRWMDNTHIDTQTMPSGPERASIVDGKGSVHVETWLPREIRLHADITSDSARIELHRFYFPGWVMDHGAVEPLHGLVSFQMPKGTHDLTLTVPEFAGERLGQYTSFATLCFLLLWWWVGRSRMLQVLAN